MTEFDQTALLLIGHGSSKAPAGARAAVEAHADRLSRRRLFAGVATAFLKGGRPPRDVLEELAARQVCVVPHFMSAGYFVETRIPELLGLEGRITESRGRRIVLCDPPALLPGFTGIVERRMIEAAGTVNAAPEILPALLVAHGSAKSAASAGTARGLSERLKARRIFHSVDVAFIEEPPYLGEVLHGLDGPAVLGGLFASDGFHAEADVRGAVENRPALAYTGALGGDPGVAELIAESCRIALSE